MPTATKRTLRPKPATLRHLCQEMARLRRRVEDLEDLRDLSAAVTRNAGKPGIPWAKAKATLSLA